MTDQEIAILMASNDAVIEMVFQDSVDNVEMIEAKSTSLLSRKTKKLERLVHTDMMQGAISENNIMDYLNN